MTSPGYRAGVEEWVADVRAGVEAVTAWLPVGAVAEAAEYAPEPAAPSLKIRLDGRVLILEPAYWSVGERPARLDLRNDAGARLRFEGPFPEGWRVLTRDLIALPLPWERATVEALVRALAAP